MAKLARTVVLRDPDDGEIRSYVAGEDLPERFLPMAGAHLFEAQPSSFDGLRRPQLEREAERLGVDPSGMKVEELRQALDVASAAAREAGTVVRAPAR